MGRNPREIEKGTKTVEVLPCTCAHGFQDEKYGKGMRLFNICKGEKTSGMRCTVCGNKK